MTENMINSLMEMSHWVIIILMACLVKILMAKLEKTEKANTKFAIAAVIFGCYTAALLIGFSHLNLLNVENIDPALNQVYMLRHSAVVLMCNLAVAIVACIYFFSREKRKLSQTDKMKLKDL